MKQYETIVAFVVLFASAVAYATEANNGTMNSTAHLPAETGKVVRQTCPVIPQNKVDPNIFTEYKGEKVYFCCTFCRAAFLRNPEKYIRRLSQLAQNDKKDIEDNHQHQSPELTLAKFIKPVGIITLSLLTLTVLAGLFRRKRPKLLLKWHKRLGITTLVSALIHLILVLTAH